jgi:hypothetical protein
MDLQIKTFDMLGLSRTQGFLVVKPYLSSQDPSIDYINAANRYYTISLVIGLMVAGMFSFPLCYLVYVQSINIANNTTTNARYSKYAKLQNQQLEDNQKI